MSTLSVCCKNLSDAHIIGHVIDKDTKEHLSYITVRIEGTTFGTNTDATGHYSLKNIPQGDYTVEAACVGYVTQKKKVKVNLNHTVEVNFELQGDALMLDQVVVTGNKSEVKRRNSSTLVNVVVHRFLISSVHAALQTDLISSRE